MFKATAKSTTLPDASGTRATSDQTRDHTESGVQSSDHGTSMAESSAHPTTAAIWQRDPDLMQSDHNMTQDSIINDSGFIPSTPPAKKVSITSPIEHPVPKPLTQLPSNGNLGKVLGLGVSPGSQAKSG